MNWKRIIKWSAAFAVLGALVIGVLIWLVYLPPNGNSVNRVRLASGAVALTFDDGPNPPHTSDLLDVLRKHEVKATFFMTGQHINAHPAIVRAVADEGHEIANHSYDETVLAFKSRKYIEEAIGRTDDALRTALGFRYQKSSFFRAPKGRQLLTVAGILRSQGRIHIGASVLGDDWTEASQKHPEQIVTSVLDGLKPGDIIALHDGCDQADGEYRGGTVIAVDEILRVLKARGVRVVTVTELLRLSDQKANKSVESTGASG